MNSIFYIWEFISNNFIINNYLRSANFAAIIYLLTIKYNSNIYDFVIINLLQQQFYMQTNRAVPPQGKVPYYRSDGTGRDTYIRQHNGGLLSRDRIHSLNQPKPLPQKRMTFAKNSYGRHPHSYKVGGSNKFPHYISDGSGRDFYVKNGQGGNSYPHRWRDHTDFKFKSTLRSSQRLPNNNPQKKDVYQQTQRGSMSLSKFNKTYSTYQKQLDHKLSEPKKTLKPPPIESYFEKKYNQSRTDRICQHGVPHERNTFYPSI